MSKKDEKRKKVKKGEKRENGENELPDNNAANSKHLEMAEQLAKYLSSFNDSLDVDKWEDAVKLAIALKKLPEGKGLCELYSNTLEILIGQESQEEGSEDPLNLWNKAVQLEKKIIELSDEYHLKELLFSILIIILQYLLNL